MKTKHNTLSLVCSDGVKLGSERHVKQHQDVITGDIYATLYQLLVQARKGQILGIAVAIHYDQNRHEVGAAGSYRKDAVLLRGAGARIMQDASSLDPAA